MQRFSYPLMIVFTAVLSWPLGTIAQTITKDSVRDEQAGISATGSLSKYEGFIVDSIEIENREIYDTDRAPYDNFIFRTANKLHVATRKAVISRELLVFKGDRFSVELAEEISRNLRNRYAIYDAWVEIELLQDNKLLMRVVTIDEWSLTGGIEIKREGNEYRYKLGFEERNFLGFNQLISFDYFIQEKDDNFFESSFRDIRFLSYPLSISLGYSDDPENEIRTVSLSHPFYTLSQKFSYGIGASTGSSRNEVFRDSWLAGKSQTDDDLFVSAISYRIGHRLKNIVTEMSYNYTFERTKDKEFFGPSASDSAFVASSFPQDSMYHLVAIGLRGFLVDFEIFDRVDGFGFTEDFIFGHTAALSYGRAFNPDFDDHVYDQISFQYSVGINLRKELFYLSYTRTNKFRGERDYQRFYHWSGNYYHRGPDYLTIAFNTDYLRDWRFEGTENLTLGGKTGLRGYATEFRTGDRMAVFNLEGRIHPDIRLFSAVIGFALFVDAGRAWKPDETVRFRDFYFGGGVGLRFALDRNSRSSYLRVDLAYSEENKWEISLGTGQYFSYRQHSLFLTSR